MVDSNNKVSVSFIVNRESRTVNVWPLTRLLDVLREELHLTGTKEGCGEGECGSCSVLIDGQLANSCLVPITQVSGAIITTIEGVSDRDRLHSLQETFLECGGAQCGICTPGMIMAALYLLEHNQQPTATDIRNGLAGNLCRCTGYTRIFEAVEKAGERMRNK